MKHDRTAEKCKGLKQGTAIYVPDGFFPDGSSRPDRLAIVDELRAGMIWFHYQDDPQFKVKTIPFNGTWENAGKRRKICESCGYDVEVNYRSIMGEAICAECYKTGA